MQTCPPKPNGSSGVRVSGRLPVSFPLDTRHSIILPAEHRVTRLLVADYHERFLHGNHATVTNEIRVRFYIPGLRGLLRRVISDCEKCRFQRAQPVPPQMGPHLPEARAAVGWQPFTYSGDDYFGPVEVTIGRRREKR